MKFFLILFLLFQRFESFAQVMPQKFSNYYESLSSLNFEEKMKRLDSSIKKDPKESWYFWMKAELYSMMGVNDDAIQNFERSIQINPKFSGGHASLARFYCDTDSSKLDLALNHINKAIEFEPTEDGYQVDKGRIYFNMKKYDLAMIQVDKASVLSNLDPLTVVVLKIEILSAQNRKDELNRFVIQNDITDQVDVLDSEFCLLLATVYEEIGDKTKTCKIYNAVIEQYQMMEVEVPKEVVDKSKICK